MSIAAYYRVQAARLHSAADRLERHGNCRIHAGIARTKAQIHARRAATAARWEQMASTPLSERPGGFPGDPYNNQRKVKALG